MQDMTNEPLPDRWLGLWKEIRAGVDTELPGPGLEKWLQEVYFDGERKQDLASEEIAQLGQIIRKLLRFEPSARASASDILRDPWFRDEP